MRIAICEDEEIFASVEKEELRKNFSEAEWEPVIEVFEDGLPLIEKIKSGEAYDLLLLDLQLQNSDGLEIAAAIRQLDSRVPIIFVTGIEERAAEGYGVDAFDYVVKSQLTNRLAVSIERLKAKWQKNRIILDTRGGEKAVLDFEDVLWVESEKRGVKVVTAEGELFCSQPIGKIAPLLPKGMFTESYKSVFVNLLAIRRIGNESVLMANGVKLPLSRRKRAAVMNQVLEAVKGEWA